jgi:dipeptidyl aminopeptidase/acylaminoacyl peptidase
MALIGYSYGGEMAGFVEGKTDHFKAIVSGAPVMYPLEDHGPLSGGMMGRPVAEPCTVTTCGRG